VTAATVAVWGALVLAFAAARVTLRRRALFLLGRRGQELAPAVLASLWLLGLLLGQVTHSLVGMTFTAAFTLVLVAVVAWRKFPRLRVPRPAWTFLDLTIVVVTGFLFWMTDLWDFDCHQAVVGQYLHGNLPPTAFNDPGAPLGYHPVYDAVVAVVMSALPLELGQAMALVSIGCVALTVATLRAISRTLFRSPMTAQLSRLLFAFGYGPVFLRYLFEEQRIDVFHGRTSQAYVDIVLRRPAGMGEAFFTLGVALLLPLYRAGALPVPSPATRRRAVCALAFFLPACALLPQMAEETALFTVVLLAPLVLMRRLPAWLVVALGAAGVLGVLQSGVVLGFLGHGTMAVPRLRLAWPPALPNWKYMDDGAPLTSPAALMFFLIELGPVYLAALALALASRDARRRALVAVFLSGVVVVSLLKPQGWPKADLDRFLFYGTPFGFMLAAALIERLERNAWRPWRIKALAVALIVTVCTPPLVFPAQKAGERLTDSFAQHALGGELKRHLRAVGAREPILTTRARANELVHAGFLVVAPFDGSGVGNVTEDHFDAYVRAHGAEARWWFFPENDAQVAGKSSEGRDGGYTLVRASAQGSAPLSDRR
jgi:hypothetical protein